MARKVKGHKRSRKGKVSMVRLHLKKGGKKGRKRTSRKMKI